MPRNYNPSVWVHVPVTYTASGTSGTAGTFQYCFRSRVPQADFEVLGCIPLIASELTAATGYAIGVNYPKPPRAKRAVTTGGSESTFCDAAKIATIEAEGWQVVTSRKGSRNVRNSKASQTYVVTIDGLKYAWNLPKLPGSATIPAALADLGARPAEVGETGLVWGASFPKPPRGSTTLVGTGGAHSFSTFVSPTVTTVPDGWAISGGKYSLQDLQASIRKTGYKAP